MRVITWPMAFIIIAKGESKIYFWTELSWTAINIGASWICIRTFGLNGAGFAFFGTYVIYLFLVYPVVHRLSGFRWSAANGKTGLLFFLLFAGVLCGFYVLPPYLAMGAGTLAMMLSTV